jgi:hypothetical protein
MIHAGSLVLLSLAAACLGLRTTSLLMPRVNAVLRLIVSIAIGAMFVKVTLQVCDSYHLHDLGLGLLLSLSPVGVYDLAKWWFRRNPPVSR